MIKRCEICGREFVAQRTTAKYCSNRCRVMAKRGHGFEGEVLAPEPSASLSMGEVEEVVSRAHCAAADLSRASMLTPAPLCLSLKRVARKLSDALGSEGL